MSALQEVQEIVSDHMDKIKKLFKPGTKITVLVRTPGFGERDFMMTDDENPEIAAMVERRRRADLKAKSPYGEWCLDPDACVPTGRCPRDPVCGN